MTMYFSDITDKLQSDYSDHLTWYRLSVDLTLPIWYGSQSEWAINGANNSIELKSGDILGVASMKYQDTDKSVKRTNICLFNKRLNPFPLSVDFFTKNLQIFEDITTKIIRDKKITKILN